MIDRPPRPFPAEPIVAGRQQPHEILLILLSAVLGAAYLIGAPPPSSVVALISPWLVHFWAGGLALGGLLGMAAIGGRPALQPAHRATVTAEHRGGTVRRRIDHRTGIRRSWILRGWIFPELGYGKRGPIMDHSDRPPKNRGTRCLISALSTCS